MNRNIFAAILLFIGTSLLWLVLCWNIWGKVHANNATTEIQKQDSVINYNAGEYQMLLEETIELKEQLAYYENAQSKHKTTYQRTRDIVIVRDTVTLVDVIHLVNSCDSVIASDSLVINNLKEQLNIEGKKINNLQEVVVAYEHKEDVLQEEINNLTTDKKKLEKQKKRRNRALIVTSSVAILSTFVLSILL
jgi:peptidoglycan hydrolase CwlO-like protein